MISQGGIQPLLTGFWRHGYPSY